MRRAQDFVTSITAHGGKILFVGTKKQAQEIIAEEASRAGMNYVNRRWMGGLLTNFVTIRSRLRRLGEIEEMEEQRHDLRSAEEGADEHRGREGEVGEDDRRHARHDPSAGSRLHR